MLWLKKLKIDLGSKLNRVKSLSIKTLTFLGFTLVALPLVLALLYSAKQVNELSKQGASSIFTVAELINTNQKINNTLKKMERYASQYLVLQDIELIDNYIIEQQILQATNEKLHQFDDRVIKELSEQFSTAILQVHQSIMIPSTTTLNTDSVVVVTSLEELQSQFKRLININEEIDTRSREFISQQAQGIKDATEKVSHTLLQSLFIIPISLLIAGIFIVLITQPLKRLILKIGRLQQGNFEQDTNLPTDYVAGFLEIKEINDALNRMRGRLHALELQKSSFIRHISHELKTPLAAIREGTELIYDNSVGSLNSDQQEITKIIRNSTTRLQRLIEELLDFNIVLDSTSLQDKETINLSELIEQVLNDRILDIKRKNIIIEKDYPNITIESNMKQLNVIIDNLLSNAIKYSPENGMVKIFAVICNNQLVFSVSDQGSGIEKEQQGKVFDAFYQGTPAKDYNIKSSGLGLTIVKELLMRLNGDITLISQTKPPSGTTMKIILNSVGIGDKQ
ncbi:HAMP domain-containing sensor histidine kinase [Colwellia sp. 4_MG-2023]|uniref:sensor histidine kinase n=1 Tax=unclassified Colwellia TaxID=196834 RepID=UPI001C092F19|nr:MULTISPECIES: HAMP domain-containing sensor histidine kinase [unclassified Colwellia]MBU2923839.1 HAMP domain-containing histidine kinase [Colwellia sp. C2M11]MDO6508438.1 HAMP domain-containing sensor histidine kinase [Colwellia sp. 5_MG-2023]MDO6557075.1 HAMP domain-containing sensor histidine kinase [Colwellia sp. 4_MG-2023]MDO6651915.1 HAMP domain-containing sensor histidine kinase [Colwellia sp. 3_MG-2023]MDO6666876.1 HAMP domain-containing sensor histidine kinase [Colwellia sp. 2_MG-2